MAKSDIEKYIDELKGLASEPEELDLYSLKKELTNLSESSKIFEDFEKESMIIDKDLLKQIDNLSLLIKIRNMAAEIKNKKQINDKLHSLHFNLNILKNSSTSKNISSIKDSFNAFLYNEDTKIDTIINELNDFKSKLEEIEKHHSNLLPKGLDNRIKIKTKYDKHIEQLHSVHRKQKQALTSTVKLFLKMTKKYIKILNASLLSSKHLPAKI